MCGGGVAPPTQLRLCCVSGNVCGLPVVSHIFIERLGVLDEQDGIVLDVPSLPV